MKRIIRVALFLSLLLVVFIKVSNVLIYDNNHKLRLEERREQINNRLFDDIDLLYIGGSKMYLGVMPIKVWKEVGLIGINVSTEVQPPALTYYILESCINETDPQVVVMDLPGLHADHHPNEPKYTNYFMQALDLVGDRKLKKEAIKDLSEIYEDFDSKIITFPFYKDHSRWSSLRERDFHDLGVYNPYWLGGINTYDIHDKDISLEDRPSEYNYSIKGREDENAEYFYQKTINMLKEKGIDVLIVIPPTVVPNEENISSILSFIEKNELKFINYNSKENFERMNFRNKGDFYDNSHLSIVGANKFSSILASDLEKVINPKNQSVELEQILDVYYDEYCDYYKSRRPKFDIGD